MFAASMNQPFADLIARGLHEAGGKSRGTDYRGPILLHACASQYNCRAWEPDADEFLARHGVELPDRKSLAFGAFIAVVDVVDVRPESDYPGHRWATDPFMWFFARPRRIEPIRWKGIRGLWECGLEMGDLKLVGSDGGITK